LADLVVTSLTARALQRIAAAFLPAPAIISHAFHGCRAHLTSD
jgi:hypothetical protein